LTFLELAIGLDKILIDPAGGLWDLRALSMNQGGGGCMIDVSIGGQAHQDFLAGEAGRGPGLDRADHVSTRLTAVLASV
jgi:hypothetical protein